MAYRCFSARRCGSTSCQSCAWRAASRAAQSFWKFRGSNFHAVNFSTSISTVEDFRLWKVSVRNFVDHLRRGCHWWRDTSLDVWLQADGNVRGILRVRSLLLEELQEAFDRRWPVTLRAIEQGEVRREVYFSLHPARIARLDGIGRRYQSSRLTIGPRRPPLPQRPSATPRTSWAGSPGQVAPMPILL